MKVKVSIIKAVYGILFPSIAAAVVEYILPVWYIKLLLGMILGTFALGLAALLAEYIEVNDEGITHRNILGKKSVMWKDVKGYLSGNEKKLFKKRDVRIDIPWQEITLIDSSDKQFPLGDLRRYRDYEKVMEYILKHVDS